MKKLDSLIKLHQFQLDEKRRQLTDMHALSARLLDSLEVLEAEINAERQLANDSVDNMRAFQEYMVGASARRKTIEASLAQLEKQIIDITDEIADNYSELKRVEITKATQEKQYWDTVARKETNQQDEQALQQYQRRKG